MELSTAITEYLEFRYDLAAKTRQIYAGHLDRLTTFLQDPPLDSITPQHLARFMGQLRRADGRAYSPGYLHQIWRALHVFFAHATKMQWLPSNTMAIVPAPPLPRGQKPRLTMAQIEELVTAIRTTRGGRCNHRNLAIILLMVDSGLRRAEAVELDRHQVDMDTATVRIYDPKTYQWRFVPLGQHTVEAIRAYLPQRCPAAPTDRLFLSAAGQPMEPDAINSVIKRLQARLDFPLWPHLLRHTFANLYLKRGDLRRLQLILGHSSIRTTAEFYTAPEFEDIQQEHKHASPMAQMRGESL